MPRLLDKRLIGTDFADVAPIRYGTVQPGTLLSYDQALGQLKFSTPNLEVMEVRDSEATQHGISLQQWLVKNWVDISPALFDSIHACAYGQGIFVIAGSLMSAPSLATSPLSNSTGAMPRVTTWTQVGSLPFTGAIYDVQYGDSIFVACGAGGCIATSTTALSWDLQFSDPNITFYSVTFGFNKGWIAVGVNNTGGGVTYKSLDGVVWTPVAPALDNALFSGVPIYAVKYGEGLFMAVGGQAEIETNHIATSVNGDTWTIRKSAQPYAAHYCLDYGNHRWVVGTNGTLVSTPYPSSGVRSLNQGQAWDNFASPVDEAAPYNSITGEVRSICYGNGIFVAASTVVYASLDGRIFNQTFDPTWAGGTPQGLTSVYGNGIFVIANGNGAAIRCQTIEEYTILRPNVLTIDPGTVVKIGQYWERYDSNGNVIKVPVCVFNTNPPPPPPPPDSNYGGDADSADGDTSDAGGGGPGAEGGAGGGAGGGEGV